MSSDLDPSVGDTGETWRPLIFLGDADPSVGALARVLADPATLVVDQRPAQRAALASLQVDVPPEAADHPGSWVYYPWRRSLVAVVGPDALRLLRLDRNRNKITSEEQRRLGALRVGVVGLSVGHAVAHTLALEGLAGELRLADFDAVEVSNLNRVPASLFDVGLNKAVVAARRIAELDPYLEVRVDREGVNPATLPAFLEGLDVVVEECDSLDLKVNLREEARRRRIPVLMETSDRGLLDVERFDLEPDRPLFHGLLGEVDAAALGSLSTKDKVPHILRILGASGLSPRMAASLVEVGRTVTTWPQLGGDVALGGATIAAAVRRLGTGRPLSSGRVRIDLDASLDLLADSPEHRSTSDGERAKVGLTAPAPRRSDHDAAPRVLTGGGEEHPAAAAVLDAINRAPSGGNVQPWRVEVDPDEVRIHLDLERTTTMDVNHRGSHVALGAALFNARVAAAAARALGPVATFPDPLRPDLVATLRFGTGEDEALARLAERVDRRATNRAMGDPRPIPPTVADALRATAEREGGRLHLVEAGERLTTAADAMAGADRIRYLTARLHREMFDELVFPGAPPRDTGIEAETLGLDDADLATLDIIARPEVMSLLADWDAGAALGDDTRRRVGSSSALAVVAVDGATPADFVRGGSAVEAVWLDAEDRGLAVHPVSPVFLYAVDPGDVAGLTDRFAVELADRRSAFRRTVGVGDSESVALVLRLSHTGVKATRSRRRPIVRVRTAT